MKKPKVIKGLFVILVILYLLLFTIESPRCEPRPFGDNTAQSLVKRTDTKVENHAIRKCRMIRV